MTIETTQTEQTNQVEQTEQTNQVEQVEQTEQTEHVGVLAKERAKFITRRNALMSQSTANQTDSFKEMLALFRIEFPSIAEVTDIVVANGGLKQSSETKNTTMLLYIVQLGDSTFDKIYDSFEPTKEQLKSLTSDQIELKAAEYALSVYRAMVIVDKHASAITHTTKFVNKSQVQ